MARRSGTPLHKVSLGVRLLGVSVVAGAVAAGIALPAIGSLGIGAKSAVGDFNNLPADFKAPPLAQASYIYDADGGLIAKVYSGDRDRTVVKSDQIAPIMKKALVAIEDNRFYQHGAIDLKGVLRAVTKNAGSGGVSQGASTLTQQYVKNVFVEEAGDNQQAVLKAQQQTIGRKIKELKYAIKVEETLTKDQILTNYLNITFFGEQAYGVEAAAERYFSVHASQLTLPQAALLAGMVQSPTGYDPVTNPTLAKERRDRVLTDMATYHDITAQQAAEAKATPIKLNYQAPRTGCTAAAAGEGFFCDYVRQTVLSDPAFGATAAARAKLWHQGGLRIRTTLDPKAQASATKAVAKHVYASDTAATGISMIQPGTGKILAMAQSRPYGVDANQHQTTLNYNATSSLDGGNGFQTGSTFKPVIAAAALENGISPSQSYASPYTMAWPAMSTCSGKTFPEGEGSGLQVHNDETSLVGPFNMQQGMAKSVNTYFASLEAQTGLCNVKNMADKMGLGTQADDKTSMQVVPSMTLGTNTYTPLQMANVYATFDAHGLYCSPIAIDSVSTAYGKTVKPPSADCQQVMSQKTADTITTMLLGVVQDGTGKPAALADRQSAGKTGTTDNGADVWFVGYTPEISSAVWVGNPASPNQSMNGQTIGGTYYAQAFGGTVAGPVWNDAMQGALDGVPPGSFTTVKLPGTGGDKGKGNGNGKGKQPTSPTNPTSNPIGGILGGIFGNGGGKKHGH
ncbi:transglycosylase domain-containing protein [Phaeacidiphilus oryzae]|uniref:transglycosylase domain-containing protein n=1 Tax=Phaeacidiphilus oryzae TaxID=348818 RepID=UPI00068C676C|nr:transglycosylase domain-containing protein [Phaeacidiphilus oryzae]